MNKLLRCETFKEANKNAEKIFKTEKLKVYIFEVRENNDKNHPYYYVTTNESITPIADKSIEIIKQFNV